MYLHAQCTLVKRRKVQLAFSEFRQSRSRGRGVKTRGTTTDSPMEGHRKRERIRVLNFKECLSLVLGVFGVNKGQRTVFYRIEQSVVIVFNFPAKKSIYYLSIYHLLVRDTSVLLLQHTHCLAPPCFVTTVTLDTWLHTWCCTEKPNKKSYLHMLRSKCLWEYLY